MQLKIGKQTLTKNYGDIAVADAGLPKDLSFFKRLKLATAYATSNTFPPSTIDKRLFMIDQWGGNGNWDASKAKGYNNPPLMATVIRSGQGNLASYDDTRFVENYNKAIYYELPRMIYHVLMPQQDPTTQVSHLLSLLRGISEMPKVIWWDIQLVNGQTPKTISDRTYQVLYQTKQETGAIVGWYTGKWFTDGYMETQDWWSNGIFPLWLATWLYPDQGQEHPGPPALPATVSLSQCMIHQTASSGDGSLLGFSGRLDLDRWMWTDEQYYSIFGLTPPGSPGDLEERVTVVENDLSFLREKMGEWVNQEN